MALTIRDAETDALVRRYATLKGVSPAQAVRDAVAAALAREGEVAEPSDAVQDGAHEGFAERLRRAQEAFKPFRGIPFDADAIIGYNEHGVPE
ncbi:MAG: hypothetical protein A4S12_04815 [Proteobacteria bacterium SG_bin5]|nr:type II toxin-antitoxin system VapB family antitoxin [Sphingomonas sp.]OQW43492.1 MAG: hypothetical protein A4S12_04815 [Proteobacteria bacterium SG_bin5]